MLLFAGKVFILYIIITYTIKHLLCEPPLHPPPPPPPPICPRVKVRMLAAAGGVARAIATELKTDGPGAPAAAAGRAYQALWPARARLQRDFHVFGGEFLMAQQAPILRGFFNGFFKLPMPLWAVRTGRLELRHDSLRGVRSSEY